MFTLFKRKKHEGNDSKTNNSDNNIRDDILEGKIEKKFDKTILRKNDISILIYDERWNSLFSEKGDFPEIEKLEKELKELLSKRETLDNELLEIKKEKDKNLRKIIKYTENLNEDAHSTAQENIKKCNDEVIRINKRIEEIDEIIGNMPYQISDSNIALLDVTVDYVYDKIINNIKRINELKIEIGNYREKLQEFISEKAKLEEEYHNMYSYFHNLIGPEEIEKLDIQLKLDENEPEENNHEDSNAKTNE